MSRQNPRLSAFIRVPFSAPRFLPLAPRLLPLTPRSLPLASCLLLLASCLLLLSACSPADRLDRILETGVLRVGMDASYPPFEYIDGEGNLVGLDVDLGRELAARLGVEARFVANLSYDGLYDALTADVVDVVISALYVDPTRMADFAYSYSYFNAGQVLVVRTGTTDIRAMADLAGRTLAVEWGSEGDVVARQWARRLASLTVLPSGTAEEALARVASGEADAAVVDHLSALQAIGKGMPLRTVGEMLTDEPYAIAVRREDGALLRAVNGALTAMEEDGTLPRLRQSWLGGP
ncbi:MAG: amino acid ABC transporter substrate-binding protein [Thermoflexales bacterium]|nr:amino acid ABC transporter substrate-binding protein [Thermoflexales bacterium]